MRRQQILAALSLFLIPVSLLSCGGNQSKSAKTVLGVIPENPIVITADLTNPARTAPWFKFKVQVSNDSDEPLTIVSMEIKVSAYINGNRQENVSASDPSESNFTDTASGSSCVYTTFGVIQPGSTVLLKPEVSSGTGDPLCTVTGGKIFYSEGNPINPSDKTGNPPRYTVTIKPLGWFGTENNPTDRYTKTFQFSTN